VQEPRLRIAYVGYAKEFAEKQIAKCRRVCERAGVALGGINKADYWETEAGGSVTGEGAQGQLTGLGFHIIIVDDPHKNRAEAESKTIRNRIVAGFEDDIETREEPTGTSIIVVHTRWHPDDLIGHLHGKCKWELINLPAVNDNGEALAPHLWPLESFEKHRRNKYKWESLYQGRPRPRGSEVFKGTTTCRLVDVPRDGRPNIGVDLAYTAKTKADKSISLVLIEGGKDAGGDPLYYVGEVERKQCEAPDFVKILRRHCKLFPRARMRWYASGTEKGAADFIKKDVRKLEVAPATNDKLVRATPVSEAWNEGRILVPEDAEWAEDFLEVVLGFTGVNDAEDDDVDALAAAFDLFEAPKAFRPRSFRVKGL
jgi:predicted phage terminase large subunit-like protein